MKIIARKIHVKHTMWNSRETRFTWIKFVAILSVFCNIVWSFLRSASRTRNISPCCLDCFTANTWVCCGLDRNYRQFTCKAKMLYIGQLTNRATARQFFDIGMICCFIKQCKEKKRNIWLNKKYETKKVKISPLLLMN